MFGGGEFLLKGRSGGGESGRYLSLLCTGFQRVFLLFFVAALVHLPVTLYGQSSSKHAQLSTLTLTLPIAAAFSGTVQRHPEHGVMLINTHDGSTDRAANTHTTRRTCQNFEDATRNFRCFTIGWETCIHSPELTQVPNDRPMWGFVTWGAAYPLLSLGSLNTAHCEPSPQI